MVKSWEIADKIDRASSASIFFSCLFLPALMASSGSTAYDLRMSRSPPSPVYTLRGAGAPLNTLHFSCTDVNYPLLFSGSGKGEIHMWNLNTRRAQKILEGHSGNSVIWVSTLQTASALISQGRDMQVCLWDLTEGRSDVVDSVWTGSVGFCQCCTLEMNPGNYLLAFAGEQTEEIKIMELPSKTLVCTLVPDAKLGMVMCIQLFQTDATSGPLLLAGYEDGSLLLWDVTQRSTVSSAKAHPEPVMCLTFDTERLRGISGSSEKKLASWALDRQQNLQVSSRNVSGVAVLSALLRARSSNNVTGLQAPQSSPACRKSTFAPQECPPQQALQILLQDCVTLVNPGVSQLCLRGDHKLLASAGWDHRVRIFGWKKLQPLAVLKYHTDMVQSVAFSDHQDPRQRLLAAGSKDQRISLWSVFSEEPKTA
ncbi:Guanine nucleotide-binding protein subunit beta-like protein 1 [Takifugu flavidus]|uniref:Guanine nucleotide-binding protein subunit beta-like protein 1 n=1 Tax=Takifugu flavidus TaxID=433684 RepID=A0A5C6N195_9TELE|nr:Guanine nucleotide-binding protein subunit beta-like protein 1 [Takifugu flavidus]